MIKILVKNGSKIVDEVILFNYSEQEAKYYAKKIADKYRSGLKVVMKCIS